MKQILIGVAFVASAQYGAKQIYDQMRFSRDHPPFHVVYFRLHFIEQ